MKNKTYHFMTSLALAIMGMTAYMSFTSDSHAHPLISFCERQFDAGFYREVPPRTHARCELIFRKMVYELETGLYQSNK